MKKIFTLIVAIVFFATLQTKAQQPVLIYDEDPWGSTEIIQAFDSVFGVGQWLGYDYVAADTDLVDILAASKFIYLCGADNNNVACMDFLDNHTTELETWVSSGKNLIIHFAAYGNTYSFGFGGVDAVPLFSNYANTVDPTHSIFNGLFQPSDATTWSGGSFSHHGFDGAGLMHIIDDDNNNASIGELTFGNGMVLFCGFTMPQFIEPLETFTNFLNNTLMYANEFSPPNIWSGAIDTDWFTAGNWENNTVPSDTSSVIIPQVPSGNPSNFPIVAGANAACKKIVIEAYAILTINANDTLFCTNGILNNNNLNALNGTVVCGDGLIMGGFKNLIIFSDKQSIVKSFVAVENLNIANGKLNFSNNNLYILDSFLGHTDSLIANRKSQLTLCLDMNFPSNITELRALLIDSAAEINLTNDLIIHASLDVISGNLSVNENKLSLGGSFFGNFTTNTSSDLYLFNSRYSNTAKKIGYKKLPLRHPSKKLSSTGKPITYRYKEVYEQSKATSTSLILPANLELNSLIMNRKDSIELQQGLYVINDFIIKRGTIIDNAANIVVMGNFTNYSVFQQTGSLIFHGENPSKIKTSLHENTTGGLVNPIYDYDDYYDEGGFIITVNDTIILKSFKVKPYNVGSIIIQVYDVVGDSTYFQEMYPVDSLDEAIVTITDMCRINPGSYELWWWSDDGCDLQYDYDDTETTSFYPISVGDDYIIIENDGWDWPYEYYSLYDWGYEISKAGNMNYNAIECVKSEEDTLTFENTILIDYYFAMKSGKLAGVPFIYDSSAWLAYTNRDNRLVASDFEFNDGVNGPKNLAIIGGGDVVLPFERTVDTIFLNSGRLILDGADLILNSETPIIGNPCDTAMIVPIYPSALVQKLSQDANFIFPVGDTIDGSNYTPVILLLSSGVYNNATGAPKVRVSVDPNKPTENTDASNFINRYWDFEIEDVNNYTAGLLMNFSMDDVVGFPSWMRPAQWNELSSAWIPSGAISNDTMFVSTNDLNGIFTAISKPLKSVSVTVTDSAFATPIENATVSFNDGVVELTQTTNVAGEAVVNIPANTYIYNVSAPCYYSFSNNNLIVSSDFTDALALGNEKFEVTFYVHDNYSDAVEGATIVINGDSVASTDVLGNASVYLISDDYTYDVEKDDYTFDVDNFTVNCSNTNLDIEIFNVSTEQMQAKSLMQIYPNPNQGSIYLHTQNLSSNSVNIVLLNTAGQIVFETSINNISNNDIRKIEFPENLKGVFYLKLHNNSEVLIQKMVIR